MGYADMGEEEDWGKSSDKAEEHVDEQVTSKKHKDQGTGGRRALSLWVQQCMAGETQKRLMCSCILHCTNGTAQPLSPLHTDCCTSLHFPCLLQILVATKGKVLSQIPRPDSVCRACSRRPLYALLLAMLQLSSPQMTC